MLRFPDVGSFLISEGAEIVVAPDPGLDERVVRLFTLGPALGVLLHQRGGLALHASSVAVDDAVVAFLGDSQWGKSTLAAACVREGARLIADDVTWVRTDGDRFTCSPGAPQLKLWPEAADALGWSADLLPKVHPELEKRAVRDVGLLAERPGRLERIYVLRSDDGPRVGEVGAAEAAIELVRHTFAADLLGATGSAPQNLLASGDVAAAVRVHTLRTGEDLAGVRGIAADVLGDLSRGS